MNNHWVGMKLNNLHLSKRALDSAINSNFVIPLILTECLKRTQLFFSLLIFTFQQFSLIRISIVALLNF